MAIGHPLIRLVRRRLLALARHLPGALEGDGKALHRTWVASRRLRELLPILAIERRGLQRTRLRKPLRRVTRTLGTVRELDVVLGLLQEPEFKGAPGPAAGMVRARVSHARTVRRREMLERLSDLDLAAVAESLRALAQVMAGPRHDRRWRTALARRLARRASALRDRIREAGSLYAPEALHRARVATKKLRYALEVADETGAAPSRAEVRTLRRMQDALGHLHDLQVLESHVRDADARAAGQSRGQTRSLEALTGAVDRECRALHARYVALAPKAAAVCDRVVRELAPAVRASAVVIAKPTPIKMTLDAVSAEPAVNEAVTGG